MKKLLIVLLIIGAIFVFYSHQKYQSGSKGKKEASSKETAPKEEKSAIDSTIDYTTGRTPVKAYHKAKKKIDNVKKTHDKEMSDVMEEY